MAMRLAIALFLLLAACEKTPTATQETDPAVAEALADPIMADPQLVLQQESAASLSVPVGAMPPVPAGAKTLGEHASAIVADAPFSKCSAKIAYSYQWMARIPGTLAPPKGAMTVEAAGSDTPSCNLRLVRYGGNQTADDVVEHYTNAARKTGYEVSAQEGGLQGTRASDGAAFRLTVTTVAGGSLFDLIVNRAR
jgi:hypothetical protein